VNIRRDALEKSVLTGLQTHLIDAALFKEFCDEFTCEVNRRRMDRRADLEVWRNERERIDRELAKLLTAIKSGGPIEAIVADMKRLEARKADLLANADEPPPLLHPNMAKIYHQRLSIVARSTPGRGDQIGGGGDVSVAGGSGRIASRRTELAIILRGDLAAILRFAANKKNPAFRRSAS
jgi:hypothetical protein